ncbi:MAG: hypothetical protein ACK4TJ_06730 [Tabrizicola sp.]
MARLPGPEAMERVAPALLANGYATRADRGFDAFWRGEAGLAIDLPDWGAHQLVQAVLSPGPPRNRGLHVRLSAALARDLPVLGPDRP